MFSKKSFNPCSVLFTLNCLLSVFFSILLFPSLTRAEQATTPSNGWIVWASDREDGRHEVYRMRVDGTQVIRLTHDGAHMAAWSPDGLWIAFRALSDETLHLMRADGSESHQIFPHSPTAGEPNKVPPFWLSDNSGVVSSDGDDYYLINPKTAGKERLFSIRDFSHIGSKELIVSHMSVDRRWVFGYSNVYTNGLEGTNGTFKSGPYVAVAVDMLNKDDIYFIGDGCEPILADNESVLYHVNRSHFIAKMELSDLGTRASYAAEVKYSFDEWGYLYFPRLSSDQQWLSFAGSQSCHNHSTCDYEIMIHKIGSDLLNRRRLTFNESNDQWPHLFIGELRLPDQELPPSQDSGCSIASAARKNQISPIVCSILLFLLFLGLLVFSTKKNHQKR